MNPPAMSLGLVVKLADTEPMDKEDVLYTLLWLRICNSNYMGDAKKQSPTPDKQTPPSE